jgi:hypothetical protein
MVRKSAVVVSALFFVVPAGPAFAAGAGAAVTCTVEEIGGGTGGRGACSSAPRGYYVNVPCWDGQYISSRYNVTGPVATGGSWSTAYCANSDWVYHGSGARITVTVR